MGSFGFLALQLVHKIGAFFQKNWRIFYFGLKFLSFKNYISGNDFPISHEPLDQNAKPGCKFKGSDVDTVFINDKLLKLENHLIEIFTCQSFKS